MLFWACVYGDKQGLSRRHTVREDMVQSLHPQRPPDSDVGQSLNFKHSKGELERWAVRVQVAVAKHPHLGDHS